MSIFSSRQEKPDYLSKTHPFMIEAWAKQGMVMDLRTGEPIDISLLDWYGAANLASDYVDYTCHSGHKMSKKARSAFGIAARMIREQMRSASTSISNPVVSQLAEAEWPEKLAAMQEDATRFLDRLQWEWQCSIRNDRLLRPIELNDLLRLRDTLAAVAAQAGDQHAALKSLANGAPTLGALNAVTRSGCRFEA